MRMSPLDLIKNFDALPNDAVVPDKVVRIILNESERSFRRNFGAHNSKLRKIQLGPRRHGRRVGDIRALVCGVAP
jgi:deoxyxylulose-5-phosphate synthase